MKTGNIHVNWHMCHNPETARKDYLAANNKEEAVNAAENIRKSKKRALESVSIVGPPYFMSGCCVCTQSDFIHN